MESKAERLRASETDLVGRPCLFSLGSECKPQVDEETWCAAGSERKVGATGGSRSIATTPASKALGRWQYVETPTPRTLNTL